MNREGPSLEYKAAITSSFLKTVSAYANYGRGKIIFGIADDGSPAPLANPIQACLDIENKINDSIEPRPRFSLLPDLQSSIVTLTVEEGLDKPYLYHGKAYCRNDSASAPVDRLALSRLVLEGENRTFDSLPSSQQDLSFSILDSTLRESLNIENTDDNVLKSLGLLNRDGYTNAAALVADKNSFPGTDFVRYGSTVDVIASRSSNSGISVLQQYQLALDYYETYCVVEVIDGTRRERRELVPARAFREAYVNAIVHRTWDVNANVQVAINNGQVSITSPGGLPSGITEFEYREGRVSVLRNPILAGLFLRLQLIESLGSGIPRIKAAYEETSCTPSFRIGPESISVTLPFVTAHRGTKDEQDIVRALQGGTELSRAQLQVVCNLTRDRTLTAIRALIKDDTVKRVGKARASKYKLA
jgi:ATP-dependent DNA helicase RecG